MPSGSHGGGGGGSHGGFSGGGGGGGFSSSFGGSSHSHRPRGPRPFRFGRSVFIVSTGRQSVLSILLVIGFFIVVSLFGTFAAIGSYSDHIKMIEEENLYYLDMVAMAEADSSYLVEGKVKDQFYKEEYGKYYITYTFKADDGTTVNGYTFSVYTREQLPNKGTIIMLAVNDVNTNRDTDSIPMDYKNFTLEDDGEYVLYKSIHKKAVIGAVIGIVAIVGLVGGYILIIVTSKKKKEEEEQEQKEEALEQQKAEEKKKFCSYCGARINPSDPVCPQCGAKGY